MKIAYIGIDILYSAMEALQENGCELMEVFTCLTDNKTEFNIRVVNMAKKLGLPCHYEKITEDDLKRLAKNGCEAVFCAGYYHKIPIISDIPMINVHPSLLPVGRGAWPMPVTILKGLKKSGVTLHKLSDELDSGDILLKEAFAVDGKENLKSLMEKTDACIKRLIAALMSDFQRIYDKAVPQKGGEYWKCPKREDYTIKPYMAGADIDRILRAFYGYECIWEEDGRSYELIEGKISDTVPLGEKYFSIKEGGFVTAKHIEEEITLFHRDRVEGLRFKYGHELSSHAFLSIFLWRKELKLYIYSNEDVFSVKCGLKGSNTWFFPCGSSEGKIKFIKEHMAAEDFALCYMRRQDVEFMEEYFPGGFGFKRDEASDEYIYKKEEHGTLIGKKYAKLRTQVHKAEREHEFKTQELTDKNIKDALSILENFCAGESNGECRISDKGVVREAIEMFDILGIRGILTYMDNKPYSIAAGYPLTEDTFDMFLAKEREPVQGCNYYVKRKFFLSLPHEYSYINMEEDLGISGLRRMKTLLAPVKMNEIWEGYRIIQNE